MKRRGHVLLESARPRTIESLLNYLKANNLIHQVIDTDTENLQ